MEITEEIQERSERIQKELSTIVEMGYNNSVSYQDAMNVALFIKMAELELQIEKLKQNLSTNNK